MLFVARENSNLLAIFWKWSFCKIGYARWVRVGPFGLVFYVQINYMSLSPMMFRVGVFISQFFSWSACHGFASYDLSVVL